MSTSLESTPTTLLGRDRERAECAAVIDQAVRGQGDVLLIEGAAGIGKTALVEELLHTAADRGMDVLTATGAETEQSFPFGVVRQLFDEPTRAGASPAVLDGVTATAATVLGLPHLQAGASIQDPLPAAFQGLYWLVSNLAQRGPLIVVVDDAQWADLPSLAFLEFLGRRVSELPCLIVLTLRRPAVGTQEQDRILDRISSRGARSVLLGPLDGATVAALVRRRLATGADDDVAAEWHTRTGGNPFLVHALLAEAVRNERTSGEQIARTPSRDVPEAVCRDVLGRLAALDPEARQLAKAVAVLGALVEIRDAATVADLDIVDAERAADLLVHAGVLSPGRPLAYLHPLLRQAVYTGLRSGERALLHRRSAHALTAIGAPATQAATHLLETSPVADPAAVQLLRRAATDASAVGLTEAAVRFLERAEAEPPPPEQRAAVLTELGFAQARGALPQSVHTLAVALEAGVDAATRAEIALDLGRGLWSLQGDAQAALDVLDNVETELLDPDTALRIQAQRTELRIGWVDGLGGLGPAAREIGLRALDELASRAHPPRPASAVLLGSLARSALERGKPAELAGRLALDAVLAGQESVLYSSAPDVLIWSERDQDAADVLEQLIEAGRRSGSPYAFAVGNLWRGVLAHRLGRVRDADADCRTCVDIMEGLGVAGLTFPRAFLVDAVAERDLAEAVALADATAPNADGGYSEFFLYARGRLRAELGRLEEAAADLRAAEPWHQSPAILPWRSSLAVVTAKLGDLDGARQLAEEELRLAKRQDAPRAIGIALRTVGSIAGTDVGIDQLTEAARILERGHAPLEQARALADLAAVLRRSRRPADAREPLRTALDLAHKCGADVLAERIRRDLIAAGARPRRAATTGRHSLTAAELRIAELAGADRSNRQIAQELFISPWTVASHLTRVYDKLSIKGRAGLSQALGQC